MGIRFTLLTGFIVLAYGFLLFHLYHVQLTNGKMYLAQAESQYTGSAIAQADRGAIYFTDKNGNTLPDSINKAFPLIYAVPTAILSPADAAAKLSLILNQPVQDLFKILSNKKSNYAALVKKSDDETAQKVDDLNIKGVYVTEVPQRFYPFNTLAAQVTGFVSPNDSQNGWSGRYGVEKYYNSTLAGQSTDINLTIDPNIQLQAEQILDNLITKYSATGGSVIVEEPATGKILAMGSYPNFDLNNYSQAPIGDFLNPAVEKIYEPGSIFKVLTMAAGIDAGKITPQTTYYDTGKIVVSGHTINDWDLKAHGLVTMTNVIELSLNTGAAYAEHLTGDAIFRNYFVKFGIPDKTGVDLPGELSGSLAGLKPHAPAINYAAASFGQGVSVTPLGALQALATIANGGKLMRPYVNATLSPQEIRQVISPNTASQVTQMMVSAIDRAQVAHIDGYSLAGKTGTAQVPDLKHGGYTDNVVNTYVGFGPTSNPKFIVFIKIDEPAGAPHAAETVVPAFRDLAQFIINYYNIPPDRITAQAH